MKNNLDDSNPVAKQRLVQAFGPDYNLAKIKSTIGKLDTGKFKVQTADPDKAAAQIGRTTINAYVPVEVAAGERQASPALLGGQFHCSWTNYLRFENVIVKQ